MDDNTIRRTWAFNIIVNEFEPALRSLLIEKILIPNFE